MLSATNFGRDDRPRGLKYPKIYAEEVTLEQCYLASIARFGDGEWRCAIGGGCTSQRPNLELARELQAVLKQPAGLMVGLPNPFNGCPRRESWLRYCEPQYARHLSKTEFYFSSFITRPDNAPWIDTPQYWERVRGLWRGVDVVLVVGDKKSITTEMIGSEAKSCREVIGPRQHAYDEIDRIEEEIGKTSARVLMCLGTTATVLAWRLQRKGVHALDLGHIGMFLRHAGAYRYELDDMTSPAYREQLTLLHKTKRWGADGKKHADDVRALVREFEPKTILDYGCGENTLADAMKPIRVSGYDPGIPERAKMPKPCDMVVSTDVLEHIEPEKLDAVLDHIYRVTGKVAYLVISTKPANSVLPDGRNAHLIVRPSTWWLEKLRALGWLVEIRAERAKDISVLCVKP